MTDSFEGKLKIAKLTKVERRVAEYILHNPSTSCFMTATDIAAAVKVSDSSVIRLARTLGYKGYPDLQRDLQNYLYQKVNRDTQNMLEPIADLSETIPNATSRNHMKLLLELTMKNLETTIENNPEERIAKVVDVIVSSRNKHVFGSRVSSASALYFGTRLSHYIENVFVTSTADTTAFERMMDTTAEDCVMIFTFEKHIEISLAMAKVAAKSGAKIIVVTDNPTSQLAQFADYLIPISDESINLFPSLLPFSFIAEIILACIYEKLGPSCAERFHFAGSMTKALDADRSQL